MNQVIKHQSAKDDCVITLNEMFNQMEYVYDGHLPHSISESIKNEFNKIQKQLISNVMYYLSDAYLPKHSSTDDPYDLLKYNLLKYKYQLVLEHRGNLTNVQFEKYLETLPLDHELFSTIGY